MQWEWKCNDCHYGHWRLCKWPKQNCHSSVYVMAVLSTWCIIQECSSTALTPIPCYSHGEPLRLFQARPGGGGQARELPAPRHQPAHLPPAAEQEHRQQDQQGQPEQEADHQDAPRHHPRFHRLLVSQVVQYIQYIFSKYFHLKFKIFSPNSIKYFLRAGSWLTWSSGWRRPWAGSSMPPNLSITSHALQSFFPSYTPCSILLSTGNLCKYLSSVLTVLSQY